MKAFFFFYGKGDSILFFFYAVYYTYDRRERLSLSRILYTKSRTVWTNIKQYMEQQGDPNEFPVIFKSTIHMTLEVNRKY